MQTMILLLSAPASSVAKGRARLRRAVIRTVWCDKAGRAGKGLARIHRRRPGRSVMMCRIVVGQIPTTHWGSSIHWIMVAMLVM
jgi:hypothetical protein